MNKQENFIARVLEERKIQERLWGGFHELSMMEWSAIMSDYLGRYSKETCDFGTADTECIDQLSHMETALVKLAAIACACYEKL